MTHARSHRSFSLLSLRFVFAVTTESGRQHVVKEQGIVFYFAKVACKMTRVTIPKRSPDLNVLDYTIWSTVETLLRKQERNMKDCKTETRPDFIKRLDRTALNLSKETIDNAIGSLRRRCQLLLKARGCLFAETRGKKPSA